MHCLISPPRWWRRHSTGSETRFRFSPASGNPAGPSPNHPCDLVLTRLVRARHGDDEAVSLAPVPRSVKPSKRAPATAAFTTRGSAGLASDDAAVCLPQLGAVTAHERAPSATSSFRDTARQPRARACRRAADGCCPPCCGGGDDRKSGTPRRRMQQRNAWGAASTS